ncbi:zinc ribbon domain-containing protein [Candidatus Microgenomates bacterium]|nr:zinc ribbon domain-containing protein [Candidatus Microgenomates bacterium]
MDPPVKPEDDILNMYCSNCGLPVAKGINFCPKCGKNVRKLKPSAKISLPSLHLPGFLSRYGIYLLTLAVVLFTLYFVKSFILEKKYEKISFGKKTPRKHIFFPLLRILKARLWMKPKNMH